MTGILNALIAGVSGAVKDTYFNLVSLLLPGNGTNGATNNSFVDSSTANGGTGWPITRNGDTTQGTFSPFSQTGWGNYFDGTGDCLSIPTSAISSVGSNDFSMECWVYLLRQTNTLSQGLISYGVSGSTAGTSYISFELTPSGYAAVAFASATALAITSSTITPINQWAHIALCRSGSTLSIFLNGSRVATTSTSATVGSTGNVLFVGSQWYANEATRNLQGYISNARIVNGSSAYDATQSTINVPTSPLTAISGTSLLTCQSNRFKDSSSTPLTVTPSGNVAVTPFSPFAPTSSYSAAAVGGSGYFDGSGDFLTVANSAALSYGTGSFTIEGWFYTAATGQYASIFSDEGSGGTAGLTLLMNPTVGNGQLTLYGNGGLLVTATGKYNDNAWHHFAISRDSTNLRLYVDGAYIGNSASGSTNFDASQPLYLMSSSIAGRTMAGYLSSFRTLKGTALYTGTGSITVPTAPLTAITNTSLLLNFTNAGVVDATAKNVLETEGNAQISTAIAAKFGSGSIRFPQSGTNDYLSQPLNDLMRIGSGDYTFECWVYRSNSNDGVLLSGRTGVGNNGMIFGVRTDKIFMLVSIDGSNWGINTYASTQGNSVPTTTWSHVAISRQGSSWRVFIDGTLSYTSTLSGTVSQSGPILIGYDALAAAFTGYLDDVRITRYARYVEGTGGNAGKMVFNGTNTLALPTAPFPVQ